MIAALRQESGPALLREGYAWAWQRRSRSRDGVARTRLLGRQALVVGGPEGARLFYDADCVRRAGAVPRPVRLTLFGKGAVHGLDDEAHAARKALFLDLLTPEAVAAAVRSVGREWDVAIGRWRDGATVVLQDEAVRVLGAGVLTWAGVPLDRLDPARAARDLATVVRGFGSIGPLHLRARLARHRTERWARAAVRAARRDRERFSQTPLGQIATYRQDGELLDERTAAVELHNLLRPTVAVSWFVTFAALALEQHPRWRERLASGEDELVEAFTHEVRRMYPFVPILTARVRGEFDWRGQRLPRASLLVLDVYGTHHDPALYPQPEHFDPRRFLRREPGTWDYLPQGGGDARTGHRCPGERLTVELVKDAVRRLAGLSYTVPAQDLSYPLDRMPTAPRSGFALDPRCPLRR